MATLRADLSTLPTITDPSSAKSPLLSPNSELFFADRRTIGTIAISIHYDQHNRNSRRNRHSFSADFIGLLGGFVGGLFEPLDLCHATLVTTAIEISVQPRGHDRLVCLGRDLIRGETKHIRIIVASA